MEYTDDLKTCRKYYRLADELMAHSTPAELAECARLLALNIAQYEALYGTILFQEFLETLKADGLSDEQLKLAASGMQTLVGMLGFVRAEDDPGEIH